MSPLYFNQKQEDIMSEIDLTTSKVIANAKVKEETIPEGFTLCYWDNPTEEEHRISFRQPGHKDIVVYSFAKKNGYKCVIPTTNAEVFESTKTHPIYKVVRK